MAWCPGKEWGGLGQHMVIGDEADDVPGILPPSIVIERRNGKAGIRPGKDQVSGTGPLQLVDQSLEHCQRPVKGASVALAQHRRQRKARAPVEDEARVIQVLYILVVEEAELWSAVGGISGGIQVQDDDLPRARTGFSIKIHPPIGESPQVFGGGHILEPG